MKVFILKEGKEYNQGVAYLDDGTMVVVDNARKMISKTIDIVVTSVLQTTAGKMIFGRYIEPGMAAQAQAASHVTDRPRSATAPAPRIPAARCAADLKSTTPLRRIPPFHWWRTVFYLIPAISVYTIVLGVASIVSSLFDRRGHFAHRCARAWSWLILRTTGVRVTVEGLERITPGTTYVFVSNHQSIYDIPVIFASLPFQLRIIAKESLAKFPMLGWHLKRAAASLRRSTQSRSADILNRWRSLVTDGLSLIIFAEGTRSTGRHTWRVSRPAASCWPCEAGLPIVPVAVIGTRHVMPKGRLRTEPGDVTLIVHDPDRAPTDRGADGPRCEEAGRPRACGGRRHREARSPAASARPSLTPRPVPPL